MVLYRFDMKFSRVKSVQSFILTCQNILYVHIVKLLSCTRNRSRVCAIIRSSVFSNLKCVNVRRMKECIVIIEGSLRLATLIVSYLFWAASELRFNCVFFTRGLMVILCRIKQKRRFNYQFLYFSSVLHKFAPLCTGHLHLSYSFFIH